MLSNFQWKIVSSAYVYNEFTVKSQITKTSTHSKSSSHYHTPNWFMVHSNGPDLRQICSSLCGNASNMRFVRLMETSQSMTDYLAGLIISRRWQGWSTSMSCQRVGKVREEGQGQDTQQEKGRWQTYNKCGGEHSGKTAAILWTLVPFWRATLVFFNNQVSKTEWITKSYLYRSATLLMRERLVCLTAGRAW